VGEGAPARLRPEGVYLITGGLGRVGLAVAAHLVRRVGARLVLTGRAGLPPREEWSRRLETGGANSTLERRIRAVLELEALGGQVLVVGADTADLAAMEDVVARTRARFGALHGVVHAAGVLDAAAWRPLRALSREECDRQLRPKVQGLEVLARVLEGEDPDFVLLMSSLSAVLGGVGYGAYAAANLYMDAFVEEQHRRRRRQWISVNWDTWASEDAPARGAPGGELARLAMEPAEAMLALDRILGLRRSRQVLVSTADPAARLSLAAAPAAVPVVVEAGSARHARPNLHSVYVAPEGPAEERLAVIWCETLGIERVGRDDNFFELGGTSLLAIRMVAKAGAAFGIELPAAAVFEGPTVRSMGRLVEAKAGREGALASFAPAEGSRE